DYDYLKKFEEGELWNLAHIENIENCNEYGCYEGTIKYFKAEPSDGDSTNFAVFITLNSKPKNDYSQKITDTYITTENLTIYSDVDEELTDKEINLMNFTSTSGKIMKGFDLRLDINHFLGKKDMNNAFNGVGYYHSSSTIQGIYQGNFVFKDNVKENTILAYYNYKYPNDEEVFKNTVKISMDFKKINPVLMFIKSNDTLTLEQEHKIEFTNE
ncbi:MAG: hypothetical protein K0Q49_1630, partial [Haloplasmataceae bacterium]|nr:hypothetical protein [Haloplasmataceae bacterium]